MDTIVSAIEINSFSPAVAGRLEHVRSLTDRRLTALAEVRDATTGLLPPAWAQAPAFEVHIRGGIGQIMADVECRMLLRHIVARAEEARVVVFLHEPLEVVSAAITQSGALTAALEAGKVVRHTAPRAVRS